MMWDPGIPLRPLLTIRTNANQNQDQEAPMTQQKTKTKTNELWSSRENKLVVSHTMLKVLTKKTMLIKLERNYEYNLFKK